MRYLLGIVALLCLTALQSQAADEKKADKTDKDKLQGTWMMTSVEIAGKTMEIPEDKRTAFTFAGDKLTIKEGKETGEGSFKMDESKKAKEIDITTPKKDNPKEMETVKGIYQIDGDTLKVYMSFKEMGSRPTAYDSKDNVVLIFKRQKS